MTHAARFGSAERPLDAKDHGGGPMDWFSADADPNVPLHAPRIVTESAAVPTRLEYPGAPLESEPVERVQFGTDEQANVLWALERIVGGRAIRLPSPTTGPAWPPPVSAMGSTRRSTGDGKVFFFKGANYLRYDIAADTVEDGYPLAIADLWPGFAAAGFGSGVRAAVQLSGTSQTAQVTGDLPDEFFSALKATGVRLACHPIRLLLVMYSESGVKTQAMHPSGGAVGINQLTTVSLPVVGWNGGTQAFRQLSASQQLPYVEKYFARFKALDLDSTGRLYQLNHVPATAHAGQGPDTVLTEHNGVLADAYDSNRILDADMDGRITIGDLETTALRHRTEPRWKEIEKRMQ